MSLPSLAIHSAAVALLNLKLVLVLVEPSPIQDVRQQQAQAQAQDAYEQGQRLMAEESFEEAAARFRTAIRLDPLLFMAYYALGQSQMALKRYPEAIQAYLGCRASMERAASLGMQETHEQQRARDDEIRELKDSLHRLRSGQLKLNASAALLLEVQLEDRLRVLEGFRVGGRENLLAVPGELMLALGSAYFRSGQTADAERAYTEAVKIAPKLGAAHSNLAVIYMMNGRFTEAREAIRRAEKAGFKVSPALKDDLEERARRASPDR